MNPPFSCNPELSVHDIFRENWHTKDMARPKSQNRYVSLEHWHQKNVWACFFPLPCNIGCWWGIQSQIQLLYPDSLGMSNKRSRVHWLFYGCRNGFWNTGKRAVHVIEQSCSWQRWKCLAKDGDLTYRRFWSGGVSSKGPLWLKDPQRMRHI